MVVISHNQVFVIPPNAYLTLQENSFVLSESVLLNGLRMPIDTFLWSLTRLLSEQVEAANKHCPIQVFATDMEEFSLSVGRTGLYPTVNNQLKDKVA